MLFNFSLKSDKLRCCGQVGPPLLQGPKRFCSSFFASDEFRMFGFKIKLCPLSYRHDWTDCPYAHYGEKARRRDPSQINYLAIACPEYRSSQGKCPRGELCGLAHGIFEYWLHPAKYKTRPCNAGLHCKRKVCFFAHEPYEIRPGVDYGVYWGQGTTSGAAELLKEATELGANEARSERVNLDLADVEWVCKLLE